MKIKFTPVKSIVNHTLLNNNNNNKKELFFCTKSTNKNFWMFWPVPGSPCLLVLASCPRQTRVILSQLCSKAKTGQSSKALGKESTESKENRAEYIQSLSSPTTEQSVSPAASALPNKTSPSTPLAYPQVNRTPSEALGRARSQSEVQ